jgi:hypothetical protein
MRMCVCVCVMKLTCLGSFNKRRENFQSDKEYNDYLEMSEDISMALNDVVCNMSICSSTLTCQCMQSIALYIRSMPMKRSEQPMHIAKRTSY